MGLDAAAVEKAIIFHNINGRFPTTYDLGLSATYSDNRTAGDYYYSDNAPLLNPYIGGQAFQEGIALYFFRSGQCSGGAYFNVITSIDPGLIGFSSNAVDDASNTYISCELYNNAGVINKLCSYYFGNGTTNIWLSDNLIAGWINWCTDSVCATTNPILNDKKTAYINAITCQ